MSFYIGKDNSGSNIVHLTNLHYSQNELMSGIKEDTIFHSNSLYLTYKNTGERGAIRPFEGNYHKFYVTFSSSVALDVFNGKAVIVLFKRAGSSYYTMSYSTSDSYYTASSTSTTFSLLVHTLTPNAYLTVDSVIAITFSEKRHSTSNILINDAGIFLNGTNALTDKYAITTSSPHNSIDVSLKITDNLFLQLYNTSSSWVPGIKFDSNTMIVSRNSTNGYIPILHPTKGLTPVKKYVIGRSTHNNLGNVTAYFTQSFSPSTYKKYMTVLKCDIDQPGTYIDFNFIIEGTNNNTIMRYGYYPSIRIYMDIKLNTDGSLTCSYAVKGLSFPEATDVKLINATGFIYEFN